MDRLRTLIDDDAKRVERDAPRFGSKIGRQLAASLLAEIEGIIYHIHGKDASTDYTTLKEARKEMTTLHSGESEISKISFDSYLKKLDSLPSSDFTLELRSFFNLARSAETDINSLLSSFVEEERAVGVGTSLLPSSFYVSRPVGTMAPDYYLRTQDYKTIEGYFHEKLSTLDMSPFQNSLLETLRLNTEELIAKYPNPRDSAQMLELKTQLRAQLQKEGVLSWAQLDSFFELEEPFTARPDFFREDCKINC